jgi:hypothetical protein
VRIDTTDMPISDVVERVMTLVDAKIGTQRSS